jgi:uncharacterized protein YndB with AHSA1/START domain
MARGFFVISDISGYTQFLTQSELEHAKGILEALFKAIIGRIEAPLAISNFQGDAILCYSPETAVAQKQSIVEAVENIYCAFAETQEQMAHNTSCTCNACRNIPNLDLKFIVHHGEYLIQALAGREELAGPDVIVAHRLMKNDVTEQTGIGAYALVTEAAASAMALEEFFAVMPRFTASYDHIGEVGAFVHALRPVWERRRHQRRIFVEPDEPHWLAPFSIDLPVPPARAWAYLTEPSYRGRWVHGMTGVTVSGDAGGRVGMGASFHCAHGKQVWVYQIVDWRPYDYISYELPLPLGVTGFSTFTLTPIEGGTRISNFVKVVLPRGNPLRRLAAQTMLAAFRRRTEAENEENRQNLLRLAEAERAAGTTMAPPSRTVAGEEMAALVAARQQAPQATA